jgi:hypothetical protein
MLLVMLHDLADYDHPNGRQIRFETDDIDTAAASIADAYGEPVDEIKAQLMSNRHDLNFGGIITTAVAI